MTPTLKGADDALVLAALLGLGAVYAGWQFFRCLRRDRFAADTPISKIRSAAQGYVHLEGEARPTAAQGEVLAPLTNRPCVWWDFKVEQYRSGRLKGAVWTCVEQGTSVSPFLLHYAAGQCLVGPVGAEIMPTARHVWHGKTPRPDGPPAIGLPFATVFDDGVYRYTESLLAVGARVTVLGELRSQSLVTEIDAQVRALLSEWKQDQAALLARFDTNRDGQLDASEWDAARAAAKAAVEAQIGGSQSRLSVVGETTHGQPFLIAALDGRKFVSREKHRAALAFCATVVLAGLAAILAQRGLTAYETATAPPNLPSTW